MIALRNNSFVIRCDSKDKDKEAFFALRKFTINYTHHTNELYYEEKQHSSDTIKDFVFDYKKQILILVIQNPKLKSKGKMLFKIIDCKTTSSLIQIEVGDKEIIGRIKSGLFKLVDGHFYFGNQVFKIRYDLLEREQKSQYNEFQIFDKYD